MAARYQRMLDELRKEKSRSERKRKRRQRSRSADRKRRCRPDRSPSSSSRDSGSGSDGGGRSRSSDRSSGSGDRRSGRSQRHKGSRKQGRQGAGDASAGRRQRAWGQPRDVPAFTSPQQRIIGNMASGADVRRMAQGACMCWCYTFCLPSVAHGCLRGRTCLQHMDCVCSVNAHSLPDMYLLAGCRAAAVRGIPGAFYRCVVVLAPFACCVKCTWCTLCG